MKTAVTIAGEGAGESAFVVWRGFEASISKASQYGYEGVELALKDAGEINRDTLRKWLRQYHMEVSCITTGQVFADLGLYFTHPDLGIRTKAMEVLKGLADLAGEFGGRVNVGRSRGFVGPGQSEQEVRELCVYAMQRLCDYALPMGVEVLIEPVNRYESNFINSLDQGKELLRQVGRKNAGLHADVFHMNIEDDRIDGSILRNGEWIRYVHFADSNRLAPGLGHLDFDAVMGALKTIGYDGWISMEMLPGESADEMAGNAIQFMAPKVEAYNRGGKLNGC